MKVISIRFDYSSAPHAGMSILFLFLSLALAAPAAVAGEYNLIKGQGEEVCEAYKRNFESFDKSKPMACERKYHPDIKGFASASWENLDLKKRFKLYQKAEIYLQKGYLSKEAMQERLKHLEERAEAIKAELYLARIDLNDDGQLDNVLAVRDFTCGPNPASEKTKKTRLYILNSSLTDIDYARQKGWSDFYNNATIMRYKGKYYIERYSPDDGWRSLFSKRGHFYVVQESSHYVKEYFGRSVGDQQFLLDGLCEFEYLPSGEKSSREHIR